MNGLSVETLALAFLTALITPAIVLLACANLITGCHMRLGRVMDRVRALAQMAEDIRLGKCTDHPMERRREIGTEFRYYERRGKMILVALSLLYGTVGFFVATSIAVGVDLLLSNSLAFVPVVLASFGISLFLVASLLMLLENRLAFETMKREIQFVHKLEEAIFQNPEGTV
ncbi:MAG: DUF2721 domain-containing protein [candidate division NC10 bacterium]|nr:DUF2721 domain-containing protein [candidate division NC10 bacterium]